MESTISAISSSMQADRSLVRGTSSSGMHGIDAPTAPNASDASLFASMMQSKDVSNVAQLSKPSIASGPSMIEKLAVGHVADMRDLVQSSRDLIKDMPNMSMAEMVVAGSEMTLKMTMTTTQFSMASAIGKSAGSGFQTLMKNQ